MQKAVKNLKQRCIKQACGRTLNRKTPNARALKCCGFFHPCCALLARPWHAHPAAAASSAAGTANLEPTGKGEHQPPTYFHHFLQSFHDSLQLNDTDIACQRMVGRWSWSGPCSRQHGKDRPAFCKRGRTESYPGPPVPNTRATGLPSPIPHTLS